MYEKRTIEITAFGETREVECSLMPRDANGRRLRVVSILPVLVGRFPTGTKLHRTTATLWCRNQPVTPLRGETAAVIDGEEFVLDATLYTHNRNNGRIVGWYADEQNATRMGW